MCVCDCVSVCTIDHNVVYIFFMLVGFSIFYAFSVCKVVFIFMDECLKIILLLNKFLFVGYSLFFIVFYAICLCLFEFQFYFDSVFNF